MKERYSKEAHVMITPKMFTRWSLAAESKGLSLSAFVRMCVNERIIAERIGKLERRLGG